MTVRQLKAILKAHSLPVSGLTLGACRCQDETRHFDGDGGGIVQPTLVSFPSIVRIVVYNVIASGIHYEKLNLRIWESEIVKCTYVEK